MKNLVLLSAFLSLNTFAQTANISCVSIADSHNGDKVQSQFLIPKYNDVSIRTFVHDGFVISVSHESDNTSQTKFLLEIIQNDASVVNENIEIGGTVLFETPNFSYSLSCSEDK